MSDPNPVPQPLPDLVDRLARGDCVLFVGDALEKDGSQRVQLAAALVDACQAYCSFCQAIGRCQRPQGCMVPLTTAAQEYESWFNRRELVDFIRNLVEMPTLVALPSIYVALAALPVRIVITTAYDNRLENAFRAAGRRVLSVINDTDVPFDDQERVQMIYLHGALSQPESLILTISDTADRFDLQSPIIRLLQTYLASKTLFFVGYELNEPNFLTLYYQVLKQIAPFARKAYAMQWPPNARAIKLYQGKIELIDAEPLPYLQLLSLLIGLGSINASTRAQSVQVFTQLWESNKTNQFSRIVIPKLEILLGDKEWKVQSETSVILKKIYESDPGTISQEAKYLLGLSKRHQSDSKVSAPYKGVDSYGSEDTILFSGRDSDIDKLTLLIHANRLVVFCGASGVGKTSLLAAGVLPRLDSLYALILMQTTDDPISNLRRKITQLVTECSLSKSNRLQDMFRRAQDYLGKPLIVIIDQFEKSFLLQTEKRKDFFTEFIKLCKDIDTSVKFVICVREDLLARTNEILEQISDVRIPIMRLSPLTKNRAIEAILKPGIRFGIQFEVGLPEKLVEDLVSGNGEDIAPVQLQMVMNALYYAYQDQTTRVNEITLALYQQLGGAKAILQRYYTETLAGFPPSKNSLDRYLLDELVTSTGTRTQKTFDQLASVSVESEDVVLALNRLIQSRLVRTVMRDDQVPAYEIVHDYLAAMVVDWEQTEVHVGPSGANG